MLATRRLQISNNEVTRHSSGKFLLPDATYACENDRNKSRRFGFITGFTGFQTKLYSDDPSITTLADTKEALRVMPHGDPSLWRKIDLQSLFKDFIQIRPKTKPETFTTAVFHKVPSLGTLELRVERIQSLFAL